MCKINKLLKQSLNYKNIKILIAILTIIILFNMNYVEAAGMPTLINKLYSAMRKIKEYLIKLATPTAAVAIASGVLVRKLSFGDEEKLVKGRKIIVNAIIGYGIILCIDLIIKFVESIL